MSENIVPWLPLTGAVASLFVGALFAAADIAVTSLSPTRLEALIEQAEAADKVTYQRIRDQESELRSRYLLGRVSSTAVTAICLLEVFEPAFPGNAGWIALTVAILVTSVTFEITTTLARKHADRAAVWAARWLRPLEMLVIPLAHPLGWLGARMRRRGGEQPPDPRVTEAEVEALVDEGERSGVFAGEPAEMIRNVLEFAERTAKDVMIPRSQVDAIELTTPIVQVLRTVADSGHSRYPVYREQIDNVVGLLYAKDLYKAVQLSEEGEPRLPMKRLDELVRAPANFVHESQPLATLLREMRSRRQHLAVVVDEFGSVSGIVTMEDVLEEIVGEIHDEHDTDGTIEDLGEGRVLTDAAVTMKDLFHHLGADLPGLPGEGAESVGGMLTEHLGRIPTAGTAVNKFGMRFIVRLSDAKHVCKVEVLRSSPAP